MQGKVKWFSQEKGYGYLVADNGDEHYFNVRHIQGADMPRNGDRVEFESARNQKGLVAKNVKLLERATSEQTKSQDERVECSGCGKKMVPRLVYNRGSVTHSVCPYCAKTYRRFNWVSIIILWTIAGMFALPFVVIFLLRVIASVVSLFR